MLKNLLPLIACAASITAAHAVPITGKVVGPDDKPVAGAEIVVIRAYDTDHPSTATTNEAGTFTVDLEPIGSGTPNFGTATAYAPPLAFGDTLLKPGNNVIKLERAASVQGIAQDKAGQPVADAIVKLQYAKTLHRQTGDSENMSVPPSLDSKFTVKTGADGHWSIGGIPASKVAIVLLDDPRFAQISVQARPGEEAATALLTALPGAGITGRVVHEDGTPAGGIKVSTYGGGSGVHTETAADGTYTLTSLGAGSVAVTAYDPTGKLVTPVLYGVQAKAGQTVKVADRILSGGALLEGLVTDQATGAPLPAMPIMAATYGPEKNYMPANGVRRPVNTDKDGHFKIRVAPGKISLSIWWSLNKYLPLAKPVEVELHAGDTKTVSLQLTKGLSVAGLMLDAAGKPVANAEFSASLDPALNEGAGYSPPARAQADGAGKWTLDGLKPGQWDIKGTGDWEVVSPKQLVVPLTTPVKVTVRPIQWQTLTGRVLTRTHKPVAGAQIKAMLEIRDNERSSHIDWQETLTDAQGQFAIEKLRPDAKISISTTMPGYKYVAGGKVTKQETGFTAQDLIFTPLNEKLEGRVVDTFGQPVAGAQIMSPDGDLKAPTTSDADGRFTLTGLPEGEVMVIADLKGSMGEARGASSRQPLKLTLTPLKVLPAHATQRAYEILDDLWATTEGDKYYRNHIPATLAPFDPDMALKLATRQDGSVDDSILSQVIIDYARADPERAVQWAPTRLNQIKNVDGAIYTKMSFALAIATAKPALAQELYQQAKPYFAAQLAKHVNDQQTIVGRAVLLTPLARKLGLDDDANQFVQAAVAMAKTTKERNWLLAPLASVEYDETAKMIDELDASKRPGILREAVSESSKYDLKLARRWLDKLEETEKKSASGAQYTGMATQTLIKALGQSDPAGALALARAAPTDGTKPLALAMAAQFQTREVALQALHEAAALALQQQFSALDTISRIAAQAYDLDTPFGLDLFATARERAESEQARNNSLDRYGYDESSAAFAFYYSRVDPAASRLMLEAEFARRLQQPKGDAGSIWQANWQLRSAAAAMAAIDVERALELSLMIPVDDLNQGDSAQAEAQRSIAQYLLLSDSQRRTKPFQEWNVVDEAY